MTELVQGQSITAMLNSPEEEHNYRFRLPANQPITVSFTAVEGYKVTYTKEKFDGGKDGGAIAHSAQPQVFPVTESYEFLEASEHTVYLTVASADPAVLPNDSYTLRLS